MAVLASGQLGAGRPQGSEAKAETWTSGRPVFAEPSLGPDARLREFFLLLIPQLFEFLIIISTVFLLLLTIAKTSMEMTAMNI